MGKKSCISVIYPGIIKSHFLHLVYSFDFNYVLVIVLIFKIFKQQKPNIHATYVYLVFKNRAA